MSSFTQFLRLMLVPIGGFVAIISIIGIVANYFFELDIHNCFGPGAHFPVCGSAYWLIIGFFILALIGAVLVIVGLGARIQDKRPQVTRIPVRHMVTLPRTSFEVELVEK